MPRLDRGIQYAAAYRLNHTCLWNTGSPAFAGDDSHARWQLQAPAADVLEPGHEFASLHDRCRHHRRRRRRPRRRACAEGHRPLQHRSGSPRPARRPRHTIQAAPDVVFDVGCGWLHSADQNSFVGIAGQLGFELNKDLPPWRRARLWQGVPAGRSRRVHRCARRVLRPHRSRPRQAARTRSADRYLEPGNRWNPMIDAISTYVNGCELDQALDPRLRRL